jgi:hypothetical protein
VLKTVKQKETTMKTNRRKSACCIAALSAVFAAGIVHAEPTTFEWETQSGLLFSDNQAAIEEITGQSSVPIMTPVGLRFFVEGSMNGTFTYDPEVASPLGPRGSSEAYVGPSQDWTAHLISGGATIGTFTGDVGETIVRDGDAVPGGQPDLVNVNMCGAPWCLGVTPFTVGDWQATNSSLVWIGDGFQDGFLPPPILPPLGAPPPLALFTVFNAQTGENTSILSREVVIREMALAIDVDVKPGSDPNCFNINGHGVVPVAILGSTELDVANVDASSLSFGGLSVRVRGNRSPQCNVEDTNGDGYPDLVCQFEDDSAAWVEGTDMATVEGRLFDGTRIAGSDSICLVP